MNKLLSAFIATLALSATAAERIPLEEAQKATLVLNNALGEVTDAPFRIEVNAFQPFALKGESETAALVVPAYSLKERIKDARRRTRIPAGQLWLHHLRPVIKGVAAPADSLRRVKIKTGEGESEVSMFHLAFERYGDGGKLHLFGRGAKPLLEILLQPVKGSQVVPLELEAKYDDPARPELIIRVVGQFEGRLPLAPE